MRFCLDFYLHWYSMLYQEFPFKEYITKLSLERCSYLPVSFLPKCLRLHFWEFNKFPSNRIWMSQEVKQSRRFVVRELMIKSTHRRFISNPPLYRAALQLSQMLTALASCKSFVFVLLLCCFFFFFFLFFFFPHTRLNDKQFSPVRLFTKEARMRKKVNGCWRKRMVGEVGKELKEEE